jgi:hypothetical protein
MRVLVRVSLDVFLAPRSGKRTNREGAAAGVS